MIMMAVLERQKSQTNDRRDRKKGGCEDRDGMGGGREEGNLKF